MAQTIEEEVAASTKEDSSGSLWDSALPIVSPEPSFLHEVEEVLGERITPCFQCVKCSGGCPLSFAMDVLPHRLIRMVQMGLAQEVLQSSTIWLCAGCETCGTRCPNGVDIAHLNDALRQIARKRGVQPGEPTIAHFHSAFLKDIRARGRLHEIGLVRRYKVLTGTWMKDLGLGLSMFARGKLKLAGVRIRDRAWLKRVIPR